MSFCFRVTISITHINTIYTVIIVHVVYFNSELVYMLTSPLNRGGGTVG